MGPEVHCWNKSLRNNALQRFPPLRNKGISDHINARTTKVHSLKIMFNQLPSDNLSARTAQDATMPWYHMSARKVQQSTITLEQKRPTSCSEKNTSGISMYSKEYTLLIYLEFYTQVTEEPSFQLKEINIKRINIQELISACTILRTLTTARHPTRHLMFLGWHLARYDGFQGRINSLLRQTVRTKISLLEWLCVSELPSYPEYIFWTTQRYVNQAQVQRNCSVAVTDMADKAPQRDARHAATD
jgi:hypothetical protein